MFQKLFVDPVPFECLLSLFLLALLTHACPDVSIDNICFFYSFNRVIGDEKAVSLFCLFEQGLVWLIALGVATERLRPKRMAASIHELATLLPSPT